MNTVRAICDGCWVPGWLKEMVVVNTLAKGLRFLCVECASGVDKA